MLTFFFMADMAPIWLPWTPVDPNAGLWTAVSANSGLWTPVDPVSGTWTAV